MNWDDPEERFKLVERVGIEQYNKLFAAYREACVIATVGGHKIRPIGTRFGRLFAVGNTLRAFATLSEAEAYAKENPIPNERR